MSTTKRLRLGPLPKTEATKMTFNCSANLKADLDRYAVLHTQAYDEGVDAATLVPHMLVAFMAGDRGGQEGNDGENVAPKTTLMKQTSSP